MPITLLMTVALKSSCADCVNSSRRGTFCDVVLKGCEKSAPGIPCHRSVLGVHSAYFRAVFTQDWKDSSQPVFQLRNIDSYTLNEVVKYAYTLDLSLDADNVQSILEAAEFLQMAAVAGLLDIHALASQHHTTHMVEAALGLIRRHFLLFTQRPDFLQMDAQQLIALIASDDVDVPSDDQVLEAVIRWVDHDRPGRSVHLLAVLQVVRVPFLSDQGRQEYALALSCAPAVMPEGPSALGRELTEGTATTKQTNPRHSVGAPEVILCVGGCSMEQMYELGVSVDVFSPSIPAVWRLKELPVDVEQCGAVMLDARGNEQCHVEVYDRVSNQWLTKGDTLMPRNQFGCASVNGKLYALGGYGTGGPECHDSIEVYDEAADRWELHACRLPQGKSHFGCAMMQLKRDQRERGQPRAQ
ncbi:kelch-like protein 17 [Paramacrobiotus metropolitanus]|uniref:kelch-like protein 17 n=1 Tax=Paramacrobiotus metropolitanus TaxID=2943436 RepID=UPI002445773A|nr:kelch-like protein 17 [Paramacrobiotus metropolitanus]